MFLDDLANVKMVRAKRLSHWRKLAFAQWSEPREGNVYAAFKFNLQKTVPFLEALNFKHPHLKITINHLVAKAIALTLKKYPQINGLITRKQIYFREHVDVFFQVHLEMSKVELAGLVVRDADQKTLIEIATETQREAERLRKDENHPQHKAQGLFSYIPISLMAPLVGFLKFLQLTLNLNLKVFGIPRDPFGSIMITAIGSLGIEEGYAPLVPLSKVPALLAVGKIHYDWPGHLKNESHITFADRQPHVKICATFDHRFMDGALGAKMIKYMRAIVENPQEHL